MSQGLYLAFFHSYLNYENIAWGSTNKTKSKRNWQVSKLRLPAIMNNEALDINHKIKDNIPKRLQTEYLSITQIYLSHWSRTILIVFQSRFKIVTHPYSTRFHESNFSEKSFRSSYQKCSVRKGVLKLWHRCFAVNLAKFLRTPFLTEHFQTKTHWGHSSCFRKN